MLSKLRTAGAVCIILVLMLSSCMAYAEELAPNEYIGENPYGIGGPIRVKVTMDGEKITAIEVLDHHETKGIGTTAMRQLTKGIITKETIEVDDISGATLTSVAFKAAVRQAVESALGVNPTSNVELAENEYLGVSNHALGGRLMIAVTVQEGAIKAIRVVESHESPETGDVALEKQIQKMVEQNSAAVDSISGATITCKALEEAVNMALEAAR